MRTSTRRTPRDSNPLTAAGTLGACALAILATACNTSTPESASPVKLDDVVAWAEPVTLEESAEVINVAISATLDPLGGFFVADAREGQFRRYAPDGSLLAAFGKKGKGPGEFERPVAAVRFASGEILAVDKFARAALFEQSGSELVQTYALPVGPVEDVEILNDSLVLVSAAPLGNRLGEQLHIWDRRSNSIVRSFFTPPVDPAMQAEANMVAASFAAVRNDTIAAVFATADTVYLFDLEGRNIDKVPLPSSSFRPITNMPADMASNPRAPIQWASSFDLISAIEWTADGGWIVQYQTMDEAGNFMYRLVRVRRDGSQAFEAVGTPRLLTTNAEVSLLYLVHPESETENRWATARLH